MGLIAVDASCAANPPVANIHAILAPHGMRLGTVATRDIKAEDVYLSVPVSLVMDVSSAFQCVLSCVVVATPFRVPILCLVTREGLTLDRCSKACANNSKTATHSTNCCSICCTRRFKCPRMARSPSGNRTLTHCQKRTSLTFLCTTGSRDFTGCVRCCCYCWC